MNKEAGYWFPWQNDSGDIRLDGPWSTKEKAMAERESAKPYILPPSGCGVPFYAATKEEAERNAKLWLP